MIPDYYDLMHRALTAPVRDTRSGKTRSVFGATLRFGLSHGQLPLVARRRLSPVKLALELEWLCSGSSNIKQLQNNNVHIWDQWADNTGELGPVYGVQWRYWKDYDNSRTIDQLANVVDALKCDPMSRRMIVSAWNVADLPRMALPPCPTLFQFYVAADNKLYCHLFQRSADIYLGLAWDMAEYAMLTHWLAALTGREAGQLMMSITDAHLYLNHTEQAAELLSREPQPVPQIKIKNPHWPFTAGQIKITDYNPLGPLTAKVAV